MILRALAMLTAVALLAQPADAQRSSRGGHGAGNGSGSGGPCKKDVASFCSIIAPGEGRIYKCLVDHELSLSQGCQQFLEKMQQSAQQSQTGHGSGQWGKFPMHRDHDKG